MPIPKPKKYERRTEFIARFMKDKRMKEYDRKQRLAIAYKTWRER